MKKIVLVFSIFMMNMLQAQFQDDNPFQQSENATQDTGSATGGVGGEQQEAPGNPGEPVPIDDYLPLLLITAAGVAIFTHRKLRSQNS